MDKTVPAPTVEEAERVINHLLSYPDHCDATLDAVRSIMQWMVFERPTEAALYRLLKLLRKPIPEGIREGVDHVPTTRHRTTMIVEGVLKGYLDWLTKNHPETGDDIDPDYERMKPIRDALASASTTKRVHKSNYFVVHSAPDGSHIVTCTKCGVSDDNIALLAESCGKTMGAQPTPEAASAPLFEPHRTHHMLVHDNLGASPQQEVCGYCGKTDVAELTKPCAAARRMNEEEDAYHAAESEPGEHQVVLDAINGCNTGEEDDG